MTQENVEPQQEQDTEQIENASVEVNEGEISESEADTDLIEQDDEATALEYAE